MLSFYIRNPSPTKKLQFVYFISEKGLEPDAFNSLENQSDLKRSKDGFLVKFPSELDVSLQ